MVNRVNNLTVRPLSQQNQALKVPKRPATSFQQLLDKQLGGEKLKFSAHAQTRLQQRTEPLSEQKVARLEKAVQKAAAKGSRNSLVLVDDLAFVVSVANKTVITALSGESSKENVFTNIDSAVIA